MPLRRSSAWGGGGPQPAGCSGRSDSGAVNYAVIIDLHNFDCIAAGSRDSSPLRRSSAGGASGPQPAGSSGRSDSGVVNYDEDLLSYCSDTDYSHTAHELTAELGKLLAEKVGCALAVVRGLVMSL